LFRELLIDDPIADRAIWTEQCMPYTWAATLAGEVIGYCYVQAFDTVGHLQNIVVASSARQRGVGRALMAAAVTWFRARGLTSWRLNVRADNAPALALYESFGLKRAHSTKLLRLPWQATSRLPEGDAVVRALSVDRDRAAEALFDIPSGTIERLRPRGRLPFEAIAPSSGECVGLTLFDARIPRARPFRALTLGAVAPMLAELKLHAPQGPHIDVLVENDPRLSALLEDLGASVRLETCVMQAQL
jgi:N-acetylglutamate synthase-like GNAT family acetyltransferase